MNEPPPQEGHGPAGETRRLALQATRLEDGTLLLRHPAGVSRLDRVDPDLAERLIEAVAEARSRSGVERRLAAAGGTEAGDAAPRLLASIARELALAEKRAEPVEARPAPEAGPPAERSTGEEAVPGGARLLVAGDGPVGRRLAELMSARLGAPVMPEGDRRQSASVERLGLEEAARALGDAVRALPELVVAAPDGEPYRALFELQRAAVAAGVAALFAVGDADGLRLGPTVVPGASPCFGCAQLAAFSFLGSRPSAEPARLLIALGRFRTLPRPPRTVPLAAPEIVLEAVARRATAECHAYLGTAPEAREPALLTEVLRYAGSPTPRRHPVERRSDCPLCGDARADLAGGPGRRWAALAESRRARLWLSAPRRAEPRADRRIRRVGIVGGGTAGYLAALALRRKLPALDVTLIQSSARPVIGVGEATTPLLPQFLHADLGLDVHRLFREVRPTLKLGIRFRWGRPDGTFNYPFGPLHPLEASTYDGNLDGVCLASRLMADGKVPLSDATGRWRSELGTRFGYHLDNERFVRYLAARAAAAGVRAIDATIGEVEVEDGAPAPRVAGLRFEDGGRAAFDFYVDASGFSSLLLGGALGSPWVSFADSLFTDRAVVLAAPHGGRVAPYTGATTFSAGWSWSTPQRDADHRGYVFSSAFQEPDGAAAELARACGTDADDERGDWRLIRFASGRRRNFRRGNVIGLGNAYGFVEPLESTALHLLVQQIGLLVKTLAMDRDDDGSAALLDRQVGETWDYLAWFLALHYRFNRRLDSPFWRECRRAVDVSRHGELIDAFRAHGPLSYDPVVRAAFPYPDPLWGAEGVDLLLLGQGVGTELPLPAVPEAAWRERSRVERAIVGRAVRHERALELLDERPELLDGLAEAFRRTGPAIGV